VTDDDLPAPEHRRPEGVDDQTVEALGKLSEALETVDQARGFLYAFHQLTGKADRQLQESVELFEKAGATELAADLDRDLVGRNVIADRWTFQIVEDFDADYWGSFRAFEERARTELAGGERHVYEARMKQGERTKGHPRHQAGPALDD
jgi:hypothetical protein